jgi:hypothetical protein
MSPEITIFMSTFFGVMNMLTKLKRQGKAHNAEMRELQRRVPELVYLVRKTRNKNCCGPLV